MSAGLLENRVVRFDGTNPVQLSQISTHGLNFTQNLTTNNVATDQWLRCIAGDTFNAGDVVYISSYTTLPRVSLAITDVSIFPIGVIQSPVALNNEVNVMLTGVLTFDTSTWAVGDVVYMSAGGGLTNITPAATEVVTIIVGKVLQSGASGTILIQLQRLVGNDIYGSFTKENLEYFPLGIDYSISNGFLPAADYSPPSTTLALAASVGATSITVTSIGAIDDVVWLGNFQEGVLVDSISGTTINLQKPLEFSYGAGALVYDTPLHHFYLPSLETGKYLVLYTLSFSLDSNSDYEFNVIWRNESGVEETIHIYTSSGNANSGDVLTESGVSVLTMLQGTHILRGQFSSGSNSKVFKVFRFNMYVVRLT